MYIIPILLLGLSVLVHSENTKEEEKFYGKSETLLKELNDILTYSDKTEKEEKFQAILGALSRLLNDIAAKEGLRVILIGEKVKEEFYIKIIVCDTEEDCKRKQNDELQHRILRIG